MRLKLAVQAEIALSFELEAVIQRSNSKGWLNIVYSSQDTAQPALCQSNRARKTIWMVRKNHSVCIEETYQIVSLKHTGMFGRHIPVCF
jgi:hypothetical protein